MPLDAVEVEYCSLSTMPLEFCEYVGCKRLKMEKAMEGVSVADDGPRPRRRAAERATPRRRARRTGQEEEGAKAKGLTITRTNRNTRKTITNVAGLEHFPDVDVKEASKLLGKKFACGASVTKGATGKDEIDIQGDFSHEVATFMTEKFDVDAELIKLVDKGK